MARNVLLVCFSVLVCAAFAQDEDPRKPAQLVRALELKPSDAVAVLEPAPFVAPRIRKRVRMVTGFNDPAAEEHSVDVVVVYDALHSIERRADFFARLRRLLRPGGRVVNIDRSGELPEAQAAQEFTAAGFKATKTVGFLPVQYFQVFE